MSRELSKGQVRPIRTRMLSEVTPWITRNLAFQHESTGDNGLYFHRYLPRRVHSYHDVGSDPFGMHHTPIRPHSLYVVRSSKKWYCTIRCGVEEPSCAVPHRCFVVVRFTECCSHDTCFSSATGEPPGLLAGIEMATTRSTASHLVVDGCRKNLRETIRCLLSDDL